jgi:cell division transport system ATP-binding protein
MSRNPAPEEAIDAETAVVRFDDVSMRYGRNPETLRDLNFTLERGSFHFLTGASGAGKSSLLKLIYLAEKPSRGLLHLFGRDISTVSATDQPFVRRRIGVVFQDLRLLEHMSAFDNAALPLRIENRRPDTYRQDVGELLAWVGLRSRMHALPATLAGGERQRLAIARAVVNRPDILLADEPTGNVDHEMALRILRLFVELNRLGTTVLIATHDQDLVARSGRPVMHLSDGKLTQLGPLNRPASEFDADSRPPERLATADESGDTDE